MKLSAPMQLLTLVWENKQKATGHSWLKINHAEGFHKREKRPVIFRQRRLPVLWQKLGSCNHRSAFFDDLMSACVILY
jgi:hypothetical protein